MNKSVLNTIEKEAYIASARRTIDTEYKAIANLHKILDDNFAKACETLILCKGKIIVIGMGKSGHIGKKIAATFASTGNPAFFVHAGEANHGDMGMISEKDVILAISYSGKTQELIALIPLFKRVGIPIISITGNEKSTLAMQSDTSITVAVKEACPLGLAPTSSTTATLVLGDALAIALLEAKGFTHEDFALSHPAGSLGTRLLLKVEDIMHTKDHLPVVAAGTKLSYALLEMSSRGLGMTAVSSPDGKMIGIFTDGDLRRAIDKGIDPRTTVIDVVMTKKFTTVSKNTLAAQALKIMQDNKINGLFCLDDNNKPIGAFNMLDMAKSGVL